MTRVAQSCAESDASVWGFALDPRVGPESRLVPKKPLGLTLTAHERAALESLARSRTVPHGLHVRCRIVLMLADGLSFRQTAKKLDVNRLTVAQWRSRFLRGGVSALSGRTSGPTFVCRQRDIERKRAVRGDEATRPFAPCAAPETSDPEG
jgi:DNA-binding CsgD family transcriptional regulator